MNTANHTDTSPVQVLLKTLRDNFTVFRDGMPLSIGIDRQIVKQMPEVNRKVLRAALGMHTKSSRYLRQIGKIKTRFDLDGNATEELTEAHRLHAATILQERAKRTETHQKEQRDFEQKQQREAEEAEANRKRSEKLNQLAAKFAR